MVSAGPDQALWSVGEGSFLHLSPPTGYLPGLYRGLSSAGDCIAQSTLLFSSWSLGVGMTFSDNS